MDSVAVIGSGDVRSDTFAEEIARMIAPARGVRVVPSQRVRAYARRSFGAEEIGRDPILRRLGIETKLSGDFTLNSLYPARICMADP